MSNLINLKVDNIDENNNLSNPNAKISWEITDEFKQMASDAIVNEDDPSFETDGSETFCHFEVLLFVIKENNEIVHKVRAPLAQLKTVIPVSVAGKFSIACMVGGVLLPRYGKNRVKAGQGLLNRNINYYYQRIEDADELLANQDFKNLHEGVFSFNINAKTEIETKNAYEHEYNIYVANEENHYYLDKEFFAQPLPEGLRNYLSIWYPGDPDDECQLRSRIIVGVLKAPFLLAIYGIINILFLAVIIFTGIFVQYKPKWKYFAESLNIKAFYLQGAWDNIEMQMKSHENTRWVGISLLALYAIIIVTLSMIVCILLAPVLTFFGVIFFGALIAIHFKYDLFNKIYDKLFTKDYELIQEPTKSLTKEELEALLKARQDEAYEQKFSWKLIWDLLKAKVCKPYAK